MIDHYLQRLTDKGFEIYDVRRELEKQNVEEEEIKIIVRAVDDELQARLLKSANADYAESIYPHGDYFNINRNSIRSCNGLWRGRTWRFFHLCLRIFFRRSFGALFGLFKRKKVDVDNTPDPSKEQPGRSRVSFRKKS